GRWAIMRRLAAQVQFAVSLGFRKIARGAACLYIVALLLGLASSSRADENRAGKDGPEPAELSGRDAELLTRVQKLEEEVAELKQMLRANATSSTPATVAVEPAAKG